MRKLFAVSAALAAAACTTEGRVESSAEGEARLAAALAGRSARIAVDCVDTRNLRGPRVAGGALLFESGDTIYVNRASYACPRLDGGRAARIRTLTGRLCRGDIVSVYDPMNGTEFGGCALGPFIPYRR